jgi:hypothetical protein
MLARLLVEAMVLRAITTWRRWWPCRPRSSTSCGRPPPRCTPRSASSSGPMPRWRPGSASWSVALARTPPTPPSHRPRMGWASPRGPGGARQRRVHPQVGHLVPVGLGVGDHQPDVVPHEHDRPLDAQVLAQQLLDVVGHRLLVVAAGRTPRMPGASIVGSHHAEAVSDQRGDDAAPFPPRLREAVQQHDGACPLPGGGEMQAQAGLDVGHRVPHVGQVLVSGHHDLLAGRTCHPSPPAGHFASELGHAGPGTPGRSFR